MASQPGNFNLQEFSDAGAILASGRLYTFSFGTTTQKVAYTDAAATVPHTYTSDGAGGLYIALNSRGELPAPLYLTSGSYDLALKRADGSSVWTRRAEAPSSMADLSSTSDLSAGVALVGGAARVVNSIAILRTVPKGSVLQVLARGYYAAGDGGGGQFWYDSSDTTTADNGGSVIVGNDGGRWKSVQSRDFSVLQWGAKGDDTTDDRDAFNRAITYLTGLGISGLGPCGKLYAPSGKTYKWGSGISINVPIVLQIEGFIDYTPTSGVALTIGSSLAWNQYYDIFIAGINNSTGNVATPSSLNGSGASAIRVNSMNFSRMEVGCIQGFTAYGVNLDGSGGLGFQQVVQHNHFKFGQVVNNGCGIKLLSLDAATSSVEANRFFIQNIYQNFDNILLDDSTHTASTSNTFDINSMDNNHASGIGLDCWGYYNEFYIGYTASSIKLNTSRYNTVHIQNNISSGVVIAYGDNYNWVTTGPADSAQLPSSGVTITDNTIYQNTYGVPIAVCFTASVTPTAGSSETISIQCSRTSPPSEVSHAASGTMATPDTKEFPVTLFVPPGYYWRVVKSGTGTATYSGATFLPMGS